MGIFKRLEYDRTVERPAGSPAESQTGGAPAGDTRAEQHDGESVDPSRSDEKPDRSEQV